VSLLPVLLVFTIATFPGEWLDEKLPPLTLVPPSPPALTLQSVKAIRAGVGWATLHELLVAGDVNFVTDSPKSLWSNVLVLPDFGVSDRVKFDADGKVKIASNHVSLRGRSLERAVFSGAKLRRADFTGARLAGADFSFADLRESDFACDEIESEISCAQLEGANFYRTQLQGADLKGARLQGAWLLEANLQGAALSFAQL
jgi:hypothetical protein